MELQKIFMGFKNNTDEENTALYSHWAKNSFKIIPIWIFEFFSFLISIIFYGMKTSNYFSVIIFQRQ